MEGKKKAALVEKNGVVKAEEAWDEIEQAREDADHADTESDSGGEGQAGPSAAGKEKKRAWEDGETGCGFQPLNSKA